MLAVMKKLTYDDEYNFDNEVSCTVSVQFCFFGGLGGREPSPDILFLCSG